METNEHFIQLMQTNEHFIQLMQEFTTANNIHDPKNMTKLEHFKFRHFMYTEQIKSNEETQYGLICYLYEAYILGLTFADECLICADNATICTDMCPFECRISVCVECRIAMHEANQYLFEKCPYCRRLFVCESDSDEKVEEVLQSNIIVASL